MTRYAGRAVVSTITDGMKTLADETKELDNKIESHIGEVKKITDGFSLENKNFKENVNHMIINSENNINKYKTNISKEINEYEERINRYMEIDREYLKNYIHKQSILIAILSVLNIISIALNIFL